MYLFTDSFQLYSKTQIYFGYNVLGIHNKIRNFVERNLKISQYEKRYFDSVCSRYGFYLWL